VSAAPRRLHSRVPTQYAPFVPPALEKVDIPAYILDRDGRIRWLNPAAKAIAGDAVGRLFTSVLAPEEAVTARPIFERNLTGRPHADFTIEVMQQDGTRTRVQISSAALGPEGHAIGMFGLAVPRAQAESRARRVDGRLTPRQREILELLAGGASTDQIASALFLSRDTVRNHVRHILRRLGCRSRLEAVALAHRENLV
jgi:DNA-binding CsgD family transcriptional regulator